MAIPPFTLLSSPLAREQKREKAFLRLSRSVVFCPSRMKDGEGFRSTR